MCDRALTGSTAEELAKHFTVLNYDRRGRGDSGDTGPYAVEREIEDIGALIVEAGGGLPSRAQRVACGPTRVCANPFLSSVRRVD